MKNLLNLLLNLFKREKPCASKLEIINETGIDLLVNKTKVEEKVVLILKKAPTPEDCECTKCG